jgi:hypothetical protein
MTTANEAWIQNSLERLEALEQQRAQLSGSATPEQLAGLDEEIRTLYEALEAAANEEEAAAAAETPAAEASPGPFDAPPAANPFAAPAAAVVPEAPFAQPAADFADPGLSASYADDLDFDRPKSKAPLVIGIVAAVALLGGGGWFFTQSSSSAAAEPAEPAPTKVIQAGEIPDDTQEPDVARGGGADRTEGTRIRESSQPQRPRSASSSTRSRSAPREDAKATKRIEVANTRDPLAGVK